ncbi:hypothetical protein BHE74_00054838 [Ensete ventricosum]|nr:hypothetical protein BHE74_00054838 [Ensete ventricosum]
MVLLCSYLDLLDKSKGQVQLQGLSGALREGSECPRAAGTYCWEISAGASHAEIVYPYIPDPDGEDEGGQASSFLAVSTRWISAAKLLQSNLATLAQREGGE